MEQLKKVIGLLILMIMSTPALSDASSDAFKTSDVIERYNSDDEDIRGLYAAHVIGIVASFHAANTILVADDRSNIYCLPPLLQLSANDLVEMIQITLSIPKYKEWAEKPFATAAILLLRNAYPCDHSFN